MLPSVALMRIGGRDEEEEVCSGVLVLVLLGRRGFWVRKTEPRAFWEVLERRSEREEKNCDELVAIQHLSKQFCVDM